MVQTFISYHATSVSQSVLILNPVVHKLSVFGGECSTPKISRGKDFSLVNNSHIPRCTVPFTIVVQGDLRKRANRQR